MKIAIVVSHAIQHFCPMYASWSKVEGIELKVFFGSKLGATTYFDPQFNKEVSWSNLYLDEFNHEFLNGDNIITPTKNLDAINLYEKLSQFNPDLLVHYGYFHKIAKRAKAWALKNNKKIAYISDAERRRKRPIWKEVLKYPYLYFYFKTEDYFFSIGDANESYYKYYGAPVKKIRRMMFSIDIKSYNEARENKKLLAQQLKQKLSINEDEIVISTVGKLLESKCQNHLIDLLIKLEKEGYNKKINLLIAGSGTVENDWKDYAKNNLKTNNVHFLGFVNPIDLPSVYAASNVYIHPSLYDAHSLSVSEAIFMGCPIIVADTTGSWGNDDDVQINKNGFVYNHGNIEELQKQLIDIIEDKEKMFSDYSLKISKEFQELSHFKLITEIKKEFN